MNYVHLNVEMEKRLVMKFVTLKVMSDVKMIVKEYKLVIIVILMRKEKVFVIQYVEMG